VLQNRPQHCEVLVVHRGSYDDPYELRDEVGFVEVAAEADLIRTINAGIRAAGGEVVHVLQAGVQAEEGWTDPALDWFNDPMVGAVSPLVVEGDDPSRIASAGICYTAGGRRVVNGAGAQLQNSEEVLGRNIIGPTLTAAFYRRSAIDALGGLCAKAGTGFADVDIAMSLKALGFCCILEPHCVAVDHAVDDVCGENFHAGRCAERVFWRHAATSGWLRSVLFHKPVVIGSLLAHWNHRSAYMHLLGRLVSAIQGVGCCRKHRARLRRAAELLQQENLAREEGDSDEDDDADASPTTVRFGISPHRLAA